MKHQCSSRPPASPISQWLAFPVALALLCGCATQSTVPPASQSDLQAASRYLVQSQSSARTYEARLGLAVAAADLASKAIAADGGSDARAIYNAACADAAMLTRKVSLPATLRTPAGSFRLSLASASSEKGAWNPAFFSKLIPTEKIKNKALVLRELPTGYGGVLVGVHLPRNPRALFLPRVGVSAPVTAVLTSAPSTSPGEPTLVSLALLDPTQRHAARIAGSSRPLAADLTAPFGYYPNPANLGILGMLRPEQYLNQEGLFLVQPYDSRKIPIVFIHGLMSNPQMWLPVMAAIESDPVLRGKYQFWVFAYPTGNPIGYSALELREALAGVYKVYPRTRDMVIVNHSLGGVITHLQVIDSGDALVKGIFKENTPQVMALPADSPVKKALIFRANPRISRVVFVAAPHRGAPLASNAVGSLGSDLIRLPGRVLSDIGATALKAATSAAGVKSTYVPNSIHGLERTSPLLIAMNTVPIRPPFHSIIGVAGRIKTPLEKTDDTVVPYWSSHLDGPQSEKIVPYPHTAMFVKPEATDEIKRILRLHVEGSAGAAP